jgi:hypothetical protein
MTEADWHGNGRAIGVCFGLRPYVTVLLNASDEDVPFVLADCAPLRWERVLDTAHDGNDDVTSPYVVTRRSMAVFHGIDA